MSYCDIRALNRIKHWAHTCSVLEIACISCSFDFLVTSSQSYDLYPAKTLLPLVLKLVKAQVIYFTF